MERLVYDAMRGRRANFVRKDALLEASRILQPLLVAKPTVTYPISSRLGPQASDDLIAKTVLTGGGGCPWVGKAYNLDDVWSRAIDFSVAREMQLSLRLNFDQMRLLLRAFTKEMERGIASRTLKDIEDVSTIKMLETFVNKLPNGTEEGIYYGLDLGGTNFRVVKFELVPGRFARRVQERSWKIPEQCKLGKC